MAVTARHRGSWYTGCDFDLGSLKTRARHAVISWYIKKREALWLVLSWNCSPSEGGSEGQTHRHRAVNVAAAAAAVVVVVVYITTSLVVLLPFKRRFSDEV